MAPAFTLYGAYGSTNTDRVRLTLAEGGFTNYEFKLIDIRKGEQKSAENKALNPWGKIPVLVTPSGLTLYESRAICIYLAQTYNIPLLPPSSNIEATALFNQAASIELNYFSPPANRISFELFVKAKMLQLPPDEAIITAAKIEINTWADIVEGILGKQEYMAGNEFSLVDIWYIPTVKRLFAVGSGEVSEKRPGLGRWWERCMAREAVKRMYEGDEGKMGGGK